MNSFLSSHRAILGLAACLAMFAGAFMIALDQQGGPLWNAGLVIWAMAFGVELFVRASPYEPIVRFGLPWHNDCPDLDERELGLRSRAYEISYVLLTLSAIVLVAPLFVFLGLKGLIGGFFLMMSFAGSALLLPTIVLEWIAPGSGLTDGLEEA